MFIIGAGRVGTALDARARERGVPCTLVSRDAGWERLEERDAPIFVAVRNDDLDGVIQRVPGSRRADLVFTQNGMLRPWLERAGLTGVTRGLLFFAVSRRGDPITPGGVSPFWGPRANQVVEWMEQLGLEAEAVDAGAFARVELEKLVWNCALGLMCQARDGTVGEVLAGHGAELDALVTELTAVGARALGISFEAGEMIRRIRGYSETIPAYRGAVKEWPWRNGWFVERARARAIATPVHDGLLTSVGGQPASA